ncbi:MAG: DUF4349 domain-containing protein [Proteobacteria bacterium]|nr:DUF4349 domain-containing protein [Pseudomonadota bacterium]
MRTGQRPKYLWFSFLAVLALIGCSRKEINAGAPTAYTAEVKVAAAGETTRRAGSSLAYEHTVSIEIGKDNLAARMKDVRSACGSHEDFACNVLDVNLRTDLDIPGGTIRMRLASKAVEALIAVAAQGGRITSRGTHAEDLAVPISDAEREISLLSTHRDRLSEFLKRKDLTVDQVINLSKEISSAQTQLDSLNTQRANLQRRVDTELLTINFSPPGWAFAEQQTPIQDAVRSFGSEFRDAVAQVIRFTAALIPWLIIIVPGLVLLRLFWRWITRWLANREHGPPNPRS